MPLLLIPFLLPLLGGALMTLMRFRNRLARFIYVETVTVLTSAVLLYLSFTGYTEYAPVLKMTDKLSLIFHMDGLSHVFIVLIAVLWPISILYSYEYMGHEERENSFLAFYTMSYGITFGIATAANYFTMYIFFELLSLVTVPLILHRKDIPSAHAARRYLYYSITGAALGFIGMIMIITYGSVDFVPGGTLDPAAIAGSENLLRFIFVMAFVGFSVKAAIFPLHAWLPMASVAPTPVTALLHAVAVVKAGAFVALRVTKYAFGSDLLYGTWAQTAVLLLSSFTIVYGAVMAVREQHLKRRLAYSTVSNLSYILMGIALMTNDGTVGALTHMLFHGAMKITLFFCCGAILVQTGSEYIHEIKGYGRVMPFTSAVFTFASLCMLGVPPLPGFTSKWNLATAAVGSGCWAGYVGAGALIVSAVLTAVYLMGVVVRLYFQKPDPGAKYTGENRDPGPAMKISLSLLCVILICCSVFSADITAWLQSIM